MKKTNKFLTNVLLGALTLSSLGLANVQAEEVDPTTKASITIDDGEITPTFPDGAINFPGKTFSFTDFFGSEAYNVKANSGSLTLGVNDQRSLNGITDGWKLTAQLSSFTKDGEGKTLGEETYISLLEGEIAENPFEGITAPTVSENIELYAGSDATSIWSADRGPDKVDAVGVDEWTLNYKTSNIKLTIPNDELVEGSHSAIITWTFSDTIAEAIVE